MLKSKSFHVNQVGDFERPGSIIPLTNFADVWERERFPNSKFRYAPYVAAPELLTRDFEDIVDPDASEKALFEDMPIINGPSPGLLTQVITSSSGNRSFNHRVGDVDMSVQAVTMTGLLSASKKNFAVYWRRFAEFTNSIYSAF